jgi:hypothetical protein
VEWRAPAKGTTELLRSTEKKALAYVGSALVDTGRSEDLVPGRYLPPNLGMVGLGSPPGVRGYHEPVAQANRFWSTSRVLDQMFT